MSVHSLRRETPRQVLTELVTPFLTQEDLNQISSMKDGPASSMLQEKMALAVSQLIDKLKAFASQHKLQIPVGITSLERNISGASTTDLVESATEVMKAMKEGRKQVLRGEIEALIEESIRVLRNTPFQLLPAAISFRQSPYSFDVDRLMDLKSALQRQIDQINQYKERKTFCPQLEQDVEYRQAYRALQDMRLSPKTFRDAYHSEFKGWTAENISKSSKLWSHSSYPYNVPIPCKTEQFWIGKQCIADNTDPIVIGRTIWEDLDSLLQGDVLSLVGSWFKPQRASADFDPVGKMKEGFESTVLLEVVKNPRFRDGVVVLVNDPSLLSDESSNPMQFKYVLRYPRVISVWTGENYTDLKVVPGVVGSLFYKITRKFLFWDWPKPTRLFQFDPESGKIAILRIDTSCVDELNKMNTDE